MKSFIRRRIREEVIDGQNMNKGVKQFCNKMTIPKEWLAVNDYNHGIHLLNEIIGPQDGENSHIWQRIQSPLQQWKQQEDSINQQIKSGGMTGSSKADNNTYWANIQSTICEQGTKAQTTNDIKQGF